MIEGLKPYLEYRDSGFPWLGRIPAHWALPRAKHVLRERVDKGYAEEPLLAATQTKGVVRKELFESRTVVAMKDLHLLKLVRVGDFVISLRSFQGGIEYAREQGIISPAYTILTSRDPSTQPYLAWLFKSQPYIQNLSLYVTGIRQGQNVDYERLSRSQLPLPPAEEQAAIVRFLDHADRRIRRYILAKQKMIRLLEEQKHTVIHRVVTQGLAPRVRHLSAGVQSLSHLPPNWTVVALRHRYSVELGKMLDQKRITGTHLVPYLRNVDVQWGRINGTDLPKMDIAEREYARYTVRPGDLLVCEGGDVGRAAIWNEPDRVVGYQKALHRLRPLNAQRDDPRFLFYVLFDASKRGVFLADGSENTIAHLTAEKFRRYRFAFPLFAEQQAIADHLEAALEALNTCMASVTRDIALAREFRARVISDAVTGKFDLRAAPLELPLAAGDVTGVVATEAEFPSMTSDDTEDEVYRTAFEEAGS